MLRFGLHIGLALFAASAGTAVDADEIAWEAERPLRWSDFRGSVPRNTDEANVAATAASLGWTYAYEFERSGGGCIYRITNVQAAATFHSENSWVKPGFETAEVLEHEQGHFDITEIYRRTFETRTRELVGTTGACQGRTSKRASTRIAREISARIEPIYDALWAEHNQRQADYDLATGHGMFAAAQQDWTRRIAAAVDAGNWLAMERNDANLDRH